MHIHLASKTCGTTRMNGDKATQQQYFATNSVLLPPSHQDTVTWPAAFNSNWLTHYALKLLNLLPACSWPQSLPSSKAWKPMAVRSFGM